MKIGIIGATGKAGNLIAKEAMERGHDVTAIVRDTSKLTDKIDSVLEKEIFGLQANDLKQFDVIVNAYGAPVGQEHLHVEAGNVLIEGIKGTTGTRLIVVGGAGSLYVDEQKTIRLIDTPEFPKEYFATASNQAKNLEDLQLSNINWTFISPAAHFDPTGKRTGAYQLGKDNFIVNAKGNSYVSYSDYAIAVLDEIEKPKHVNQRFTIVSEAE